MGKYSDLYSKNKNKKTEKVAFDVLISDLLVEDKFGNDKIREIGGKNMEQKLPTNFVPSMFYIFMYFKNEKEKVFGDEFYDMCPLILCTGVNLQTVQGINFNFLPNNVRAAVLDILTGDFKDFYENVEDDSEDKLEINDGLGTVLTQDINGVLKYIQMKTNLDISSCIRTYSRKNMLKVRMIEYDQWKYIPFLSFKDAVRGINLAKLQSDFITKQQDTDKSDKYRNDNNKR